MFNTYFTASSGMVYTAANSAPLPDTLNEKRKEC